MERDDLEAGAEFEAYIAPTLPNVVGFVVDIPGLSMSFLPLKPGLTVLYGKNGAGKTRILEGIDSVWAGEATGVSMLVRLQRGQDRNTW